MSQLLVRSVGSDRVFADPSNVVVGVATDLVLQVECLSNNETGTELLTWRYRDGTEVPSGLQAFGVSQGGGGVLRVYPVELLREGSEFTCSSDVSTLNVTFSLGNAYA